MNWEVRTMRSMTSCFNPTLYRKTMLRFWPLWGLYGLLWMFVLPLRLLNEYFDMLRWDSTLTEAQEWLSERCYQIPEALVGGAWISAFFAILAAMACFSYLYSTRPACMMHALPLRREGLFLTQYLAGLSFFLLPHLAVAGLTCAMELSLLPMNTWARVLPSLGLWLAVQSGTVLFFFSFAAFCAMFTGHILALPAFYGILNALVMVIYLLVQELMSRFFYGYPSGGWSDPMSQALVRWCTPLLHLSEACRWDVIMVTEDGYAMTTEWWQLASPATVGIYAAAGLVLAVLALLVYRVRHVESAGDVVAIPIVRPFFRCGVALCAGLCLGTLTATFFDWSWSSVPLALCVVLWTCLGWFVAEMLLKKTFRVLSAWKGALVISACMALLCLSFFLDLFGVVGRVPQAGDVASLSVNGGLSYPNDDGQMNLSRITDPEDIQLFLDLHQAIIQERDRADYNSSSTYEPGDDYISFTLIYDLKNGATLTRRYSTVPVYQAETQVEGSVSWCAQRLLSDRELVERCYGFDRMEEGRLVEAWLSNVILLPANPYEDPYQNVLYLDGAASEDLEGLWQAVRADFQDGTIGVRYLFDNEERLENTCITDLVFAFELPAPTKRNPNATVREELSITLTPNAQRTLAWLKTFSALDTQYALWPHTYDPASADLPDTQTQPAGSAVEIPDAQPDASASVAVPEESGEPELPQTQDQAVYQDAPAA